jgi:hypothetical protein
MPIPTRHLIWNPRGLSDAVDGTNAFPGAMASLQNLMPDPSTQNVWICRPAAIDKVTFSQSPGFISCFMVVGDIAYGLVSDGSGKDLPFCVDLTTNTFLTVNGITSTNQPASPPTTGEWTPPIMDQVAKRIVVTHPGFPGGATKFGWFDISGFSTTTTGNAISGLTFVGDTDTAYQPFITGTPADVANLKFVDGQPVLFYHGSTRIVTPGDGISGPGIAAGTTVVGASRVFVTLLGDTTVGSATITNLRDPNTNNPSAAGLYAGQTLDAAGKPGGNAFGGLVTVVSVDHAAFTATVNANAVAVMTQGGVHAQGSQIQLSANTTATADNQTFVVNASNLNTITGNPNILGVQPGMLVTDGASVAAGTTVVSTHVTIVNAVGSLTAGSTTATVTTDALSTGMAVAGNGIAAGTTIGAIGSGTIVLSQPALATISSQLFFEGSIIALSQNLLSSGANLAMTISGGTPTAPLWGAGDTNQNNLPSVPLAVAQFNARAWFALGDNGIAFSDAGLPCQISNATAVQALLPGNGLPVTCFGKLQLSNVLGGIVQGLIAFQSDANMLQITGDPVTGDLRMNVLPVATGTHAPLAVFSSQLGVGFISPLGLRFVDFSGRVTEPVGYRGQGISMPFVLANNPPLGGPIAVSRICAACNGNTARITVQDRTGAAFEYWYHVNDKVFSGPHTCPASLIQMWTDTYLVAPWGHFALLRRSDDLPTLTSSYTEGGALLNWTAQSILLPDNQAGVMNTIVQSTVAMALPTPNTVMVSFTDEGGGQIDQITIHGTTGAVFQQFGMDWHLPLVFKQAQIAVSGPSSAQARLGSLYLQIRPLGYQVALPVGFVATAGA